MVQTIQIETILIANRAEIASRVIRTCKKMGIRTIAVFSDADKNLPFVREADSAIYIGASEPSKSYLDQEKIINVAKSYGADAIHPGYGFLSENVSFAEKCQAEGIIFIGPNANAIKAMGLKSEAKNLMQKHGVPVIPGYQGDDQSTEKITAEAKKIGFPILLKATAGGGGKGMRIVHNETEITQAVASVKREAKNAFGNEELIVEKYIAQGRHIEFQIFGDKHGNAIHILERECSIQRRYQKVLEESPSPIVTDELREQMGASSIAAAKALHYDNAGTVEFIYDELSGQHYFLEVNTRLQVEHPVTEAITGLDLVQLQIESAQGMPLALKQEEVRAEGYAVEARLYAEDPNNNFLPVSGKIQKWIVPELDGLRVETAVEEGAEISIYYDPMIAKIIIWGKDRQVALRKMKYTLRQLVCLGITTNQNFLLDIVQKEAFRKGDYDTHFIDKHYREGKSTTMEQASIHRHLIAATFIHWAQRKSTQRILAGLPSGWRNNFYQPQKLTYVVEGNDIEFRYQANGKSFEVQIDDSSYSLEIIDALKSSISYQIDGERLSFEFAQSEHQNFTHNERYGNLQFELKERFPKKESEKIKGAYIAPMPSQVIKVLVKEGDTVEEGDGLIVLSSMKMENLIVADQNGTVEEIYVQENTNIDADQILLRIAE